MSARIRFAGAADVFTTFARLETLAARPAGPMEPLAHARDLISSPRPVGALAFLAHLLPRREAVWWGCQCVEAILGAAARDEGFGLVTQWVRDPSEELRRQCLDFWQANSQYTPTPFPTPYLVRAVAFSGGSLWAPDQRPSPPAPDDCALSVNAAVVLAATSTAPLLILPWIRACAEAGVAFAAGGDANVMRPT
jgi:hypothetical protein